MHLPTHSVCGWVQHRQADEQGLAQLHLELPRQHSRTLQPRLAPWQGAAATLITHTQSINQNLLQ